MRILLPPSEGKTAPQEGPRLDLKSLVYPGLEEPRAAVIEALSQLGAGLEAARVLKLGVRSASEAEMNLALMEAPCAPASALYTGVLFEALDPESLVSSQRLKFAETTLIASGLFGFVRPSDLIPNHRLAIGVNLPPLGPLARWWRPRLEEALGDVEGEVVFDARSGGYQAASRLNEATVIQLGVVRDEGGVRKTITHMAKKWRGLAARHLITDPGISPDSSVEDVLMSLEEMAEASPAGAHGPTAGSRDQAGVPHAVSRRSKPGLRPDGAAGDQVVLPPTPADLGGVARLEVGPQEPNRAGGSTVKATLVFRERPGN